MFKRPYIICHMATSIDGRLHQAASAAAAGVSSDILRSHYEKVGERFEVDGWIVGRKTMAEMAKGQENAIEDVPKLARTAYR